MTGQQEMKTDTTLTWNLLRVNLPTIFAIAAVGLFINNGIRDSQAKTDALHRSVEKMEQMIEPVSIIQHRLVRAEDSIKEAHTRIDNLSNTMINNIDLIRRDVNRLTTQVEVLSTQIGIVLGDEKVPIQRRSRPGGPIPVD